MLDSDINIKGKAIMVFEDNLSKYLHDCTKETILRQEHKNINQKGKILIR